MIQQQHKTKQLALIIALLFFSALTIRAQVTVGSNIKPTQAALLELKTRQTAGTVPSTTHDDNITSTTGGFLLPRVKLINVSTMEPFIADDNADWVANTNSIKEKLAGLMVYNLTNDGTLYPGVYTWNGLSWMTSQANPAASSITGQPKKFTFYELGTETAAALEFSVNGPGTWTYQWYQVTGNNVHVRIGTKVGLPGTIYTTTATANAVGANTSKFKPQAVIRGTTRNANNTGFYKFYCMATSNQGAELISDICEVAVGCGAKDNLGEWLSFMCFNLGATELTINNQINHTMTIFPANEPTGQHYYVANEENLYGDLFQWGRIGDGHEKRGQAQGFVPGQVTDGNSVAYDTATPPTFEDGNLIGPTQHYPWRQVARTDGTYYGKFITTPHSHMFNWASNLPVHQIDLLWRSSGRFEPNDPCAKIKDDGLTYETYYPVQDGIGSANTNWRMPSSGEWGSIFKGGSNMTGVRTTATANTWEWNNTNGRGMEIRPDGETTTLFLPASGYRYFGHGNARLNGQGGNGRYWTFNFMGTVTHATYLYFDSSWVDPNASHPRAGGLTLRCIKN